METFLKRKIFHPFHFFDIKIKPNSKKIFSLINYIIKKIKKSNKKNKITIGGSVDKKTFEIFLILFFPKDNSNILLIVL